MAHISVDELLRYASGLEAELRKLHGVGPKAIRLLRAALEAGGRSFAPPHR